MSYRIDNIELAVAGEILALMGRNRVSQTRLAAHLGITQGTLSKRLKGAQPWTITDLEAVAAFFDVPITALFPAVTPRKRTISRRAADRRRTHISLVDRPDRRSGADRRVPIHPGRVPTHVSRSASQKEDRKSVPISEHLTQAAA